MLRIAALKFHHQCVEGFVFPREWLATLRFSPVSVHVLWVSGVDIHSCIEHLLPSFVLLPVSVVHLDLVSLSCLSCHSLDLAACRAAFTSFYPTSVVLGLAGRACDSIATLDRCFVETTVSASACMITVCRGSLSSSCGRGCPVRRVSSSEAFGICLAAGGLQQTGRCSFSRSVLGSCWLPALGAPSSRAIRHSSAPGAVRAPRIASLAVALRHLAAPGTRQLWWGGFSVRRPAFIDTGFRFFGRRLHAAGRDCCTPTSQARYFISRCSFLTLAE